MAKVKDANLSGKQPTCVCIAMGRRRFGGTLAADLPHFG